LLVLAVVLAVNVFIYMPVGALFPLMTREHFGGSAFDASFVEVAFGGGMLAGGVLIGVLGKRLAGPRTIGAGVLVLGGTLAVAGLLPPGAFPAFVAVCLVMGLSVPLFSAPTTALFQRLIDPAVLGRVNSLVGTMVLGAAPVGLLAAGPLAERFGVPAWFSLSGVLILCVGLFCCASPTIRGLSGGATGAPPPVLEGVPPEVRPGAADL
jgi:MFS transporter, DHA3 family, macrolide efflux protein